MTGTPIKPEDIREGDLIEASKTFEDTGEYHHYRGRVCEVGYQLIHTGSFILRKCDGLNFTLLERRKFIEPTGIGAVVKDEGGDVWVRADDEDIPWFLAPSMRWENWNGIKVAEVLSEGVEL